MYRVVTVTDRIGVPPDKFSKNVKEAVKESIADKFEGTFDPKIGSILAVTGVDRVSEGKIKAGDPSIHYQTTFKLLVYRPEQNELVSGEVVDNTEFGAFVRIGSLDGLVHISQLMDDFVSFDNKNSVFVGKQTKHTLKEGDKVRARIISISLTEQQKTGLTMRQPGLGAVQWIESEKKKKK